MVFPYESTGLLFNVSPGKAAATWCCGRRKLFLCNEDAELMDTTKQDTYTCNKVQKKKADISWNLTYLLLVRSANNRLEEQKITKSTLENLSSPYSNTPVWSLWIKCIQLYCTSFSICLCCCMISSSWFTPINKKLNYMRKKLASETRYGTDTQADFSY